MREGERALIHVPAAEGYGAADQGRKGGGWFIPGNSNLLFDIEIIAKAGQKAPAPAAPEVKGHDHGHDHHDHHGHTHDEDVSL
jgi:hypothetical protein